MKGSKQQMIEFKAQADDFNMELCDLFISCDIPLNKLLHLKMKGFFRKNFKTILPDPTTLRRYQLPKLCNIRMDQIKSELINEELWISIDETKN